MATTYVILQDGKEIATTAEKTYQIKNLTPATSYTFAVAAVVDGVRGPLSDTLTVTTKVALNKITITAPDNWIDKSTPVKLVVTTDPEIPESDLNLQWTTSNSAIATVDQTGLVTPVAPGEVTITALAPDYGMAAETTLTTTAPVAQVKQLKADKIGPDNVNLSWDFNEG